MHSPEHEQTHNKIMPRWTLIHIKHGSHDRWRIDTKGQGLGYQTADELLGRLVVRDHNEEIDGLIKTLEEQKEGTRRLLCRLLKVVEKLETTKSRTLVKQIKKALK
jgi:hypothetical protein